MFYLMKFVEQLQLLDRRAGYPWVLKTNRKPKFVFQFGRF